MANTQTADDALAEIDLRILIELYDAHPKPIDVPVEDVLVEPITTADRMSALTRMRRLHDRGYISGVTGANGLVYAALDPSTVGRLASIIPNPFAPDQKVTFAERARLVIEACDAGEYQEGQCVQVRDRICDHP